MATNDAAVTFVRQEKKSFQMVLFTRPKLLAFTVCVLSQAVFRSTQFHFVPEGGIFGSVALGCVPKRPCFCSRVATAELLCGLLMLWYVYVDDLDPLQLPGPAL